MLESVVGYNIWVSDQDEALTFYVDVLGMEKTADIDLGFMRWITVSAPGTTTPHLVLCPLSLAALDLDQHTQAEQLLAAGVLGAVFLNTDDVESTYRELMTAGAQSVQPPTQQPYGLDCAVRDPFGNQIRIGSTSTVQPDGTSQRVSAPN